MFGTFNIGPPTLNRKSFLINLKIRLMEYFRTQWITTAKNSHTGLDYLELTQFECNIKHYLFFNFDLHEVKEILKLRTVNHDLAVRTDVYKSRLRYEERICKFCKLHKVENLHHFLTECPAYCFQRNTFIPNLANIDKMDLYYKLNNLKVIELKCLINFLKQVALVRLSGSESKDNNNE